MACRFSTFSFPLPFFELKQSTTPIRCRFEGGRERERARGLVQLFVYFKRACAFGGQKSEVAHLSALLTVECQGPTESRGQFSWFGSLIDFNGHSPFGRKGDWIESIFNIIL